MITLLLDKITVQGDDASKALVGTTPMTATMRLPQPEADGKVPEFDNEAPIGGVARFGDDVAEWPTIPTTVRDKLLTIRDLAKEGNLLANLASDELRDERLKLEKWRDRLDTIKQQRAGTDIRASVDQAEAEIKSCEAKVVRLEERSRNLSQSWRPAAQLRKSIEKYLRETAMKGPVALYEGPAAKLKSGETAAVARERAARRTRTLKADARDVQSAPFPKEVTRPLVQRQIAKWADAARVDVSGLVYRLGKVEFPRTRVNVDQYMPTTAGSINVVDPVALMALTNPEALEAMIDREIEAELDGKEPLGTAQRIAKLTEIAGDILASEREEVFFSELAGLLPRPDIDPRAALGLADSMPPPSDAIAATPELVALAEAFETTTAADQSDAEIR